MTIKLYILLLISLISFSEIPKQDMHILDFGLFTLKTPSDWEKIDQQGIDSYAGSLTNRRDTLNFNLGLYSRSVCDNDEPNKHKLKRDTVNGLIAYIVIPVVAGQGRIGMSIESFKNREQRFIISGRDIIYTDTILDIFKSIMFSESDETQNPLLTYDKFNLIPDGSGRSLFRNSCASCHQRHMDFIGPNLQNILSTRSMDWVFKYITDRKSIVFKKKSSKKEQLRCIENPSVSKEYIERIIEYLN
ncbi:MAG: c-type cytochrome [Saprospiraceae bacterium]|nr:c-type cytochrome [Candidatus Vicinibacter affinis]